MDTKKLHFRESRIDQETDRGLMPDEPGGHLISELWITCECGEENVLAFWVERGGKGTGSLTCNRCNKPLLEPDATPAEKAYIKNVQQL